MQNCALLLGLLLRTVLPLQKLHVDAGAGAAVQVLVLVHDAHVGVRWGGGMLGIIRLGLVGVLARLLLVPVKLLDHLADARLDAAVLLLEQVVRVDRGMRVAQLVVRGEVEHLAHEVDGRLPEGLEGVVLQSQADRDVDVVEQLVFGRAAKCGAAVNVPAQYARYE